MAEIELVIKIPEEIYQHYKNVWQKRRGSIPESCIAFGTPLPKGHGRLIDADRLKNTFETEEDAEICKWSTYGVTSEIDDADTIIPATEGE